MPSLGAVTIYSFGFISLVAGVRNLLAPQQALADLALPAAALPAGNACSLAAIAMGLYYPLAAYQENRAFFALTVPMRLLTTSFFWTAGEAWRLAALWEGIGAALTAAAVLWDIRAAAKPTSGEKKTA